MNYYNSFLDHFLFWSFKNIRFYLIFSNKKSLNKFNGVTKFKKHSLYQQKKEKVK
jgi:hypothetical protein